MNRLNSSTDPLRLLSDDDHAQRVVSKTLKSGKGSAIDVIDEDFDDDEEEPEEEDDDETAMREMLTTEYLEGHITNKITIFRIRKLNQTGFRPVS